MGENLVEAHRLPPRSSEGRSTYHGRDRAPGPYHSKEVGRTIVTIPPQHEVCALKQRFLAAIYLLQRGLRQQAVTTQIVDPESNTTLHDFFGLQPLFTIEDEPRSRSLPQWAGAEYISCGDIGIGRRVNSRVFVGVSDLTGDGKISILSPDGFSERSQTVSRRFHPLVSSRVNPIAHMPNITKAIHRLIEVSGQLPSVNFFEPLILPEDFLEIIPRGEEGKSLAVRVISLHCNPPVFLGSVA